MKRAIAVLIAAPAALILSPLIVTLLIVVLALHLLDTFADAVERQRAERHRRHLDRCFARDGRVNR
jgi:hypothetical protein